MANPDCAAHRYAAASRLVDTEPRPPARRPHRRLVRRPSGMAMAGLRERNSERSAFGPPAS